MDREFEGWGEGEGQQKMLIYVSAFMLLIIQLTDAA